MSFFLGLMFAIVRISTSSELQSRLLHILSPANSLERPDSPFQHMIKTGPQSQLPESILFGYYLFPIKHTCSHIFPLFIGSFDFTVQQVQLIHALVRFAVSTAISQPWNLIRT